MATNTSLEDEDILDDEHFDSVVNFPVEVQEAIDQVKRLLSTSLASLLRQMSIVNL